MSALKHLKTYITQARRLKRVYPAALGWGELSRYFGVWRRSLNGQANPVADERPWITFPAIEFLERTLTSEMRVFEFGAGGSTLFFAARVKEVVSIEHDAAWARRVSEACTSKGNFDLSLRVVEPAPGLITKADPADPDGYASSDPKYASCSFRDYAASIDAYPDESFDLVLLDGRARPSCYKHAKSKVRIGGHLVLDNAERGHYRSIHEALRRPLWAGLDLAGPGPYNKGFWQTFAWKKLESVPARV